ncbi:MAG TPA: DUF4412 domain-containing protein [bacterium]|nr:DUF4412 domain-containing protein [bacterium]
MRMRKGLMLAGLCLASAGLTARAFEGKIDYRLTDKKGEVHAITLAVSGGKLRTEFSAKGFSGASILDPQAHTSTMIMDSRKSYMVMHFDPAASAKSQGKATLSKTGRTDTIAGYPVQEWVAERDGKRTSLWVTEKLGQGFFQSSGSGHGAPDMEIPAELREKGFLPLKIVASGGATIVATRVQPGSVDPSLFEVPDGYTEMKGMEGAAGGASEGAGAGSAQGAGAASGMPAGMPADAQARMEQAMQSMSPEQKAAMMKAMQGQGGN